jgi:5-(carboxyamino)imidazole ribonucleotide synthase
MSAPLLRPNRARSHASAVVGVVGGGQLARMTHQAAIGLGVDVVVLTPDADDAAVAAGAHHLAGRPDDFDALLALGRACDVVTLDHELVARTHLEALVDAGHVVRPGPATLALAQDKALARRQLAAAGFPVPVHQVIDAGDTEAVASFAAMHGWPIVCKWPTGGYDGRGVVVVHSLDDLPAVVSEPAAPTEWLLEECVPIATELAVLVARRPSGWLATYPLIETTQVDGICRELVMPAVVPPALEDEARDLAVSLADGIDAVGILAVELFVTGDGRLLVNELATRPHNSGHATLDGSATSQFENHLRAVLDWPLGDTSLRGGAAAMVNLLGGAQPLDVSLAPAALADPSVHLHLYGKAWRPGRKLGHVTALGDTTDEALRSARAAANALAGS